MTFTKEQLIAAAHGRINFANMMLSDNPEPLKERTWSIELELAHIALAALRERAEPVAWTDEQELRDVNERGCGYLFTVNPITPHADPRRVIKLYAEPPAPVAPAVRAEPVAGENLPCPFCGGACDPAGWLSEQTSGPECENCGATAENIEAWNRRTAAPAPAPVVPDAYEIIAEAWRLIDGMNPETSDWHTAASLYLNACRAAMLAAPAPAPGKEG
ncbi:MULTISPECIES: hypothetical protein [Cronobacter]|uniref:hypothetical protein n=1 Tax=Cronobacter TaxID=413496 RepID=UPI001FB58FF3|nr:MULTISPECIES: hypothetical protein [Cronobacter]MEB8565750.1 hypothetical protein [Cronobacter sakazakii]